MAAVLGLLLATGSGDAHGDGPPAPRILELGHGPIGADCASATGEREAAQVARWQPDLGTRGTRRAWRKLLGQGAAGCDAVLGWLTEGGPGDDARGAALAALTLAERGTLDHVAGVAALVSHPDLRLALASIEGLEKRLAVLDRESTFALLADRREGVPAAALPLLMGHHSEGRLRFEHGVPVWQETAYWGATGSPPGHCVEAVEEGVADDPDLLQLACKYAARHLDEGHEGAAAWLPLLVRAASGRDEAACVAAGALGRNEPPALDEALGPIAATGDPRVLACLLDGLQERLRSGLGTASTLGRLETLAAGRRTAASRRAAAMLRAWSRRIRRGRGRGRSHLLSARSPRAGDRLLAVRRGKLPMLGRQVLAWPQPAPGGPGL